MKMGLSLALGFTLSACAGAPNEPMKDAEPAVAVAPSAHAELDAMDPRTAVPLQPMMAWHQKRNMMDHLEALGQITEGLAKEDWEVVQAGAKRLESSPSMASMCEHMGAGVPGFTDLALGMHIIADEIGPAAKKKDAKAVLAATARTIASCTGCHAAFKQQIVTKEEYEAATGAKHDPAAMHGGHAH